MANDSKLEIDILKLVEQLGLDQKKMLSFVFKQDKMNVSSK
jgi:hypothetical protein